MVSTRLAPDGDEIDANHIAGPRPKSPSLG